MDIISIVEIKLHAWFESSLHNNIRCLPFAGEESIILGINNLPFPKCYYLIQIIKRQIECHGDFSFFLKNTSKKRQHGYILKKLKSEKLVDLHNIDTFQEYFRKGKYIAKVFLMRSWMRTKSFKDKSLEELEPKLKRRKKNPRRT